MAEQPPLPAPDPAMQELFQTWRTLSGFVHRARHTSQPAGTNEMLRRYVDSNPDGLIAPALLLWAADNLLMEARYREAIAAYAELIDRIPDQRFGDKPWASIALEQTAVCHRALREVDQAVNAYRRILDRYRESASEAWIHYQIGGLLEEANRDAEAIASYRTAVDANPYPRRMQASVRDLSRRNANRLESRRAWVRPSAEALVRELFTALQSRDTDSLEQLASQTHFSLGAMGSERHFVHRAEALRRLGSDLRNSTVTAHPDDLRGAGGKRYLLTNGWTGEYFRGAISFLFTLTRDGFEWSGVGLSQLRRPDDIDIPDPDIPPDPPIDEPPGEPFDPGGPEVTPATLNMKAPWPSGLHFRAGGIIGFSAQLAGFAAISYSLGPFGPLMYAVLLEMASLATPCGFGPGGLYYGQPTTHLGRDNFAIDFSRFIQGIPLLLDAGGKSVLAVADGIVQSNLVFDRVTGDPVADNHVIVAHMTRAELFAAFIIALFTGRIVRPKYTTEYLHLDGPAKIPVSVGMFVSQGARLGLVDDTGLSVADHLHFSLHDRDLTRAADSVRPTPLDGQTLNDSDDGRCLSSNNLPIP